MDSYDGQPVRVPTRLDEIGSPPYRVPARSRAGGIEPETTLVLRLPSRTVLYSGPLFRAIARLHFVRVVLRDWCSGGAGVVGGPWNGGTNNVGGDYDGEFFPAFGPRVGTLVSRPQISWS